MLSRSKSFLVALLTIVRRADHCNQRKKTDLDFVLSIIEFLSLLVTVMYALSPFCLNFIQSIGDIFQFSLMQRVFQAAPFPIFLLVLFKFLLFFFKFS